MLMSYAYISEATRDLSLDELRDLWLKAVVYNEAHDLTGALLYTGSDFVHVVEGEEDVVMALTDRVFKDDRHTDPQTVILADIGSRVFGYWPLKLMNIAGNEELRSVYSRERFLSYHRKERQKALFALARL